MTSNERAAKVVHQLFGEVLSFEPTEVTTAIASEIHAAIMEDRSERTADELYRESYQAGLEDAAKIADEDIAFMKRWGGTHCSCGARIRAHAAEAAK